jgi:autotransporter adhesin
MGDCSFANGVAASALGYCAHVGSPTVAVSYGTAVGGDSLAMAENATAVGAKSQALGPGSVAIGNMARAESAGSIAIGDGAVAHSSVAIGIHSQAAGQNTTAVGDRARALGDYSAAFGNEAAASANNSVAIGNGSVADQPNSLSVGAPGAERRITNVAPGINPTDAVNVSQLREVENRSYAGVAMSIALASGRVSLSEPGEKALGAGVGFYGNRAALAITFQGLDRSGRVSYNIGVSSDTHSWGAGAGFGVRWK